MIGYANSISSPVAPLTLDMFQRAITSPAVDAVCAEIRDALEKVKRGEIDRTEFDEEKNRLKRLLPIITPHATFTNGHRIAANAIPSGLAMLDIDHMQGDPEQFYFDNIVGHEVEWGIYLVHITPSTEGLRVIFVMPEAMDIPQAQAWLAKRLGLAKFDVSTKDLARASYLVPSTYILYINNEIFNEEPAVPLHVYESEEPAAPIAQESEKDSAAEPSDLTYRGIPYADIVKEWFARQGGEPQRGERNVKLYQLASALRAICDNNAEVLFRVLPPLGLSASERRNIVASAVKEAPKGFRKEIISIVKALQNPQSDANGTDGDEEETQTRTPFHGIIKKLPPALRSSLQGVPENMQWPVVAGLLPIACTMADGVEVEYCDGQRQRLALMSIIIGDQASGKSVCKQVVDIWKRQLEKEDADARKIEDDWKQKKKNRKANERCPEDPQVLIRVLPVTVSCSTLLKRIKNSRGHTLYSFGEELDTLRKTNGAGSWSSKYDIYRLAFDYGQWGQDYNSDQAESGVVNVAYNWTMLGTYGALRRCFKKDNVENGLSSRIMVAQMPDNSFAPMPRYGHRTDRDETQIVEGASALRNMHGFIDTPRLRKAIGAWVEEKRIEALQDCDRVKDTYRKRAAVIGFRAGVVCHLLSDSERETNACLEFAKLVAELTLQGQLSVFGEELREQFNEDALTTRQGANQSVFNKLPIIFSYDDLRALKNNDVPSKSLYTIVCRWVKAGWVVKSGAHRWQKIKE